MTVKNPSYDFGGTDIPLLYTTVGEILSQSASKFPGNEALVARHQNKRFTYKEFDEITTQFANALLELGIKKGDKVGMWSPNNWEWITVQFATAKIGAVLVNINPAYRTHELKYALNQSETTTLILLDEFKTSKYLEMVKELCPELENSEPGKLECSNMPNLRNIIVISEHKVSGTFNFYEVLEQGKKFESERVTKIMNELDPDDDINIQYTSGTTGFPKGVTLTHFNIVNYGYHVGQLMKFTEKDRLCIPVPFYHCFGMVLSNLACVTHGATMVIPGHIFNPNQVLETVQEEKCTALHGVPTMFIAELNLPEFSSYDLSELRTGIMAGAPCPVDTMQDVMNKMNMTDVCIAYGQTEASPVTTMTRIEDSVERRVSTVGQVMPWQELKIIDPATGKTVPRGEQGEICFRGYNVMNRYYNNPEATSEAIDMNRWLHSGDIGVMDQEGYVKITGRIKEMVIRGGENIYPREIEEFLKSNNKIMDVYVIGVPDIKYGEELMAWVILREGETATADELKAFCKGKITHFKIPKYWKFLANYDEIEPYKTVTGKIQKFKMREAAIKELGVEQAANIKTA